MEVRIRPLPSLMRMMGHRTTNHAVPAPATEAEDVVAWRRRRLERAGFDRALADSLAADRRADVHALLELVDRGSPGSRAIPWSRGERRGHGEVRPER
jgi:hypothetical protein